jgi:hypothetical protein
MLVCTDLWNTLGTHHLDSTFIPVSRWTRTTTKMAEHPFDTFRLRGFPSDITLSSFMSFLSQNKLEPIGEASLAPDAACSCSARTATLTLKREQGRKPQVPDSWDQVPLKVDEVMEAFTPLNDVGNTQDYVKYVTTPPEPLV